MGVIEGQVGVGVPNQRWLPNRHPVIIIFYCIFDWWCWWIWIVCILVRQLLLQCWCDGLLSRASEILLSPLVHLFLGESNSLSKLTHQRSKPQAQHRQQRPPDRQETHSKESRDVINAGFDPETRSKIVNITTNSPPSLVEEEGENKEHPLLYLHHSVICNNTKVNEHKLQNQRIQKPNSKRQSSIDSNNKEKPSNVTDSNSNPPCFVRLVGGHALVVTQLMTWHDWCASFRFVVVLVRLAGSPCICEANYWLIVMYMAAVSC